MWKVTIEDFPFVPDRQPPARELRSYFSGIACLVVLPAQNRLGQGDTTVSLRVEDPEISPGVITEADDGSRPNIVGINVGAGRIVFVELY